MKRIGLLGSMLGGAMLQLLAQGGGWKNVGQVAALGPRPRKSAAPKFRYLPKDQPSAARYWHNPADPVQAACIEAAAAKRDRKKQKVMQHADQSWMRNYAHHDAFAKVALGSQFIVPLSLNPFYIAK